MKKLISGTTAYTAFSGDIKSDRISHAYMLHFQDVKNMREALKIFALKFFGVTENDPDGKRIINETLPDLRIFPEEGKKFTAEAASALLSDCALKPLEKDKKLFIISGFNDATPLIQNKLLKTLEEPYEGVYFLLGATSLAPVLDTVKSRVKTLTIPPFSQDEIFAALERKGSNPLNRQASESCGGIFGVAENMVNGGWFAEVNAAAEEICTTTDVGNVGKVAIKYGDTKYKNELMSAIALNYHKALKESIGGKKACFEQPALIFAGKCADKACMDLKFNAFFQGLLYDLMLRVIEENEKWLKLRG
ncbi:MAG: hypothetical protein K2N23_00720 [Clostridia bacterium]|nr:hypothetical protein [Clostridia bacterium]